MPESEDAQSAVPQLAPACRLTRCRLLPTAAAATPAASMRPRLAMMWPRWLAAMQRGLDHLSRTDLDGDEAQAVWEHLIECSHVDRPTPASQQDCARFTRCV